jgi:putative phosphoribosyl transferase
MGMEPENIVELSELRNQTRIFQDREHAARVLTQMLKAYYEDTSASVLAIPAGIETQEKVRRRSSLFQTDQALETLSGGPAILVGDGLASGFTMYVAVEALLNKSSSQVVVAVPTGPSHTVQRIAANVNRIYCANIRSGFSFGVADAYKHWTDVTEEEALRLFKQQST